MSTNQNEIILYQPDNSVKLEVMVENETLWLNRMRMAILFDRDIKTIGKYVNNALKEELSEFSVVADFATTAQNPSVAKFAIVQIEGNREVLRNIEYRCASLKDLGKKLFAFSKMEVKAGDVLEIK